jgi:hypothetical protein
MNTNANKLLATPALAGRSRSHQRRQSQSLGFFASLQACPLWCYVLFASLLLPTDFSVFLGTLRFAPYRIVLIIAFFPCLITLLSGRVGKLLPSDWLLFAFSIWTLVVLGYHHGPEVMLESGGAQSLELLGAYLIARTQIRTLQQLAGAMTIAIAAICSLVPVTFYESWTGHYIVKQTAASLMGYGFTSGIDPRYGFYRAHGSFDHPILWGIFASSAIGMGWSLYQIRRSAVDMFALGIVVLGTLTSVSSGALVAVWAQMLAIVYERTTRGVPSRWRLFWICFVLFYAAIEVLSTRSAFVAVTTRISFSAGTAYGRAEIFTWGMMNVRANPILGLGLNEWIRPSYRSASVDNFWLLTAMMYGVPGFLLLASAVIYVLLAGWRGMVQPARMLRFGWTVSMAGLIVAGGTVHFWNNVYVYVVFLIGCGTLFCRLGYKHMPSIRIKPVHEQLRGVK